MGLFNRSKARSRDAPVVERRGGTAQKQLEDFIKGVDLDENANCGAGVAVDEMRAMQTSAVYACVKILAETVASLPLHLCRQKKNGNRERATEHPLYPCLYETPNPECTSFNFREAMMTSLLLWGNAYARIVRDNAGHVKELWHMKADLVTVSRSPATKQIVYGYSNDDGTKQVFAAEQVFHIKGLSVDGIKGLSPIAQASEAVGLSLATEEYGARFFGNGARPGGVIEFPGVMKEPERLRDSWNKVFQGAQNSHKVAILEQGSKYHAIGLPPEESQFLETRRFQINEICRIFRVPPHLVGDLEKATFSNIEHQSIEFVQHTIRPWLVRWEQEIARSLLSDGERGRLFARFNVDGLLRGDYATRMQGYATGRQNGWLSANDIRELEDMNPISKDQGGDEYLINGNMVSAAQKKEPGGEKVEQQSIGEKQNTGNVGGQQKGNPNIAVDGTKDG
jgi:HK97 family phage portal protein